jgi:hypothetical protein
MLLSALLEDVKAWIPSDVTVEIHGTGKQCRITVRQLINPAAVRPENLRLGSVYISSAPFGIGTWVPFVSPARKARLTVEDALAQIQDAVSSAIDEPWPGPEHKVRASTEDDGIRVWFETTTGEGLPISTISYDMTTTYAAEPTGTPGPMTLTRRLAKRTWARHRSSPSP